MKTRRVAAGSRGRPASPRDAPQPASRCGTMPFLKLTPQRCFDLFYTGKPLALQALDLPKFVGSILLHPVPPGPSISLDPTRDLVTFSERMHTGNEPVVLNQ